MAATTSWGEAHPGARASRPHNSWHSLGHLLHPARPATAPGPCFSRAHAVPAGGVAGCRIAGKLSGTQRDSMRAGRPRSRVAPPPITLAHQGGTRRLAGPQPVPMRPSCHAWWPFVVLRGPSWITLFSFVSSKSGPRPAGRIIQEQNKRKSTIPSQPWHPVAVNLNALVALRRSSWPFVDNSFSFVFFLLFQTSGAPALPGRSSEGETGVFQVRCQ